MDTQVASLARRAYTEAVLSAREEGLAGQRGHEAVLRAVIKIVERQTGCVLTQNDVESLING